MLTLNYLDQCGFPPDYETSLAGWFLYLQNAGYSVTTARTAEEGLQFFAVSPFDLILLDYAIPDMNGDDVAATMKRRVNTQQGEGKVTPLERRDLAVKRHARARFARAA